MIHLPSLSTAFHIHIFMAAQHFLLTSRIVRTRMNMPPARKKKKVKTIAKNKFAFYDLRRTLTEQTTDSESSQAN